MDQTPTLNILIVADLPTDDELLFTILRKSGLSVNSEAVRDEDFLRGRLLLKSWDMLHFESFSIPAQDPGHFCETGQIAAEQYPHRSGTTFTRGNDLAYRRLVERQTHTEFFDAHWG